MTEPLIPRAPATLRKRGWAAVTVLAAASIVVLGSASLWPGTAKELLPLRVVLMSALMVSAALVAVTLMPPERSAVYGTPFVFRFWVVLLVGDLVICVAVALAYVSPEVRHLVRSLPSWARDGIAWLFFVPMMTWYAAVCLLLGETWHSARARFRRM